MGLLDALRDEQFRADIRNGLLDALNRGAVAGTLGAPVDLTANAMNAVLMGGGVLGHKLGLIGAAQMPQPVEMPVGGSEWIGQKMQNAGMVSPQRNAIAEALSSVAGPAAMVKAGQLAPVITGRIADIIGAQNGKIGASAASRSPRMSDPKPQPQRPFDVDYPQGAPGPDGSRLTRDIDDRPIHPDAAVYGRRVVGGVDEGIRSGEAGGLLQQFGAPAQAVHSREIGGDAGKYWRGFSDDGRLLRTVRIDQGLDAIQADRVARHELGHLIDDAAMNFRGTTKAPVSIPEKGVTRELAQNYSELNTPMRVAKWQWGSTPESQNYPKPEWTGERLAEAIRAYQQDPNAFKTKFPELAKRLREYVNTNPNTNRIVHLNSAGGGLAVGGVLAERE